MSSGDNVTADDNVTSGDVNSAIEQYFTEYENISVHETMLKVCRIINRTQSFVKTISTNNFISV